MTARPWHPTDVAVCAALAALSAGYLALTPWRLGASDEGYYFYHAVRMLGGEVLYRDVAEFVAPLFVDVMAALFRVFGANMTTARTAGAAIQAGVVAATYAACRVAGVRRGLATVAALGCLTIAQPAWPYNTPHWLGTMLVLLLLLVSLDRERARRRRSLLAQGVLVGLLAANRQQTGVVMAGAMCLLALTDALADRRWQPRPGPGPLRRLALIAAAAAAVVVPILGAHAVAAGPGALIEQLVVHPLTRYSEFNRTRWAEVSIFTADLAAYTVPLLLAWLPLAAAGGALLRALIDWRIGSDRARAERSSVLLAFALCSILGTLYHTDFIHVAFITPIMLVVASDLLDGLLSRMPGRNRGWIAGGLTVALLVACGVRLERNLRRGWDEFPFRHQTAFGRVDLRTAREVAMVARATELVQRSARRELFAYPGYAALYLMTGARNPTPHELLAPGWQSDQEIATVIETLERERVGQVMLVRMFIRPGDPIAAWVDRHYHCEPDGLCVRADAAGGDPEDPPAGAP